MSQPVKLSDVLVLDARLTGQIAERSIAGQIEYWANLGRAIEPLLHGDQALALCQNGRGTPSLGMPDHGGYPQRAKPAGKVSRHVAVSALRTGSQQDWVPGAH